MSFVRLLVCILVVVMFSACESWKARSASKAIAEGDLERARAIYAGGVDPDTRIDDMTALMMAACNGPGDAIRLLLDAGADPNLSDTVGRTSLMRAATCGNAPAVESLLAAGADPHATTVDGRTALDEARTAGVEQVVSLLSRAAGASGTP